MSPPPTRHESITGSPMFRGEQLINNGKEILVGLYSQPLGVPQPFLHFYAGCGAEGPVVYGSGPGLHSKSGRRLNP